MTVVLHPLNQQRSKYLYIEAPCTNNKQRAAELARNHHVYIDMEVPITSDEKLIMKVKLLRNGDNIYTIQYQNLFSGLIVRTDSKHIFDHVDIEIRTPAGEWQEEKNVYDTPPDDYESRVNTVLRYAERLSNRRIGIEYWIPNLVRHRRDLVYSNFDSFQHLMETKSAFTDIARLVSLELYARTGQTNYSDTQITEMITRGFLKCQEYEHQNNNRPLKIFQNWIQKGRDDYLMPFQVITESDSPWLACFDDNAREITCEGVQILGKVSYENR